MEDYKKIRLLGKLFLRGIIMTKTGLHIGGATTGLEIGGVSSVVVRDLLTNRPYIPGSSLKGKMRSLLEKYRNKCQKKMTEDIYIHRCETKEDYEKCDVCQIFGIAPVQEKKAEMGESPATREKKSPEEFGRPTLIIVRDAMMTTRSAEKLEKAATDLQFTEVKWEAVIDRVTSKAMPRQIERVPAGVEFDFSLCYNIFEENQKEETRDVYLKWVAAAVGTVILFLNLFYFTNILPSANKILHVAVARVERFVVEAGAFIQTIRESKNASSEEFGFIEKESGFGEGAKKNSPKRIGGKNG